MPEKPPPQMRMTPPAAEGKKVGPSAAASKEKAERYIVRWTLEGEPLVAFSTHQDALSRTGELFDEYGADLEIEIHLNRVDPPPSILYNSKWLQEWNGNEQQPVRGD